MSAFAAGIVFGAFLSHMIPDATESFSEYMEHKYGENDPDHPMIKYPWAPLIMGASCIFLMSVDRLVIARGMHGEDDEHSHDHISKAFLEIRTAEESRTQEYAHGGADEIEKTNAEAQSMQQNYQQSDRESQQHKRNDRSSTSSTCSTSTSTSSGPVSDPLMGSKIPSTKYGTVAASVVSENHGHSHGHHNHHGHGDDDLLDAHARDHAKREAAARAYIFFFALSLHATFDGLSLGSEPNKQGFYSILAAVLSHKIFDGLALGIPVFLAELPPLQTWAALIICAAATPIGIAIGMGATSLVSGEQTILAEAIIISLSGGSFLFISLMELLPAALHDGRWTHAKVLSFCLGWLVMAIIAAFV